MRLRDYKSINNSEFSFNMLGRAKIQLLVAAFVILAGLFATQLVFASNLATDGKKLANVEKSIAELEAQNAGLKVKIAKTSSLMSLSEKADDLGFKKPSQVITP